MNSVSLHRLRLTVQSVSPGGKLVGRFHHAFDQEAAEDLSVDPRTRAGGVLFRQVPQPHDGFHPLEQLNDILPINNVPLKLRFTTATIPCVHRTCQWSGCTTFTTRSTMSCVAPMARRWPCRPGCLVPKPRTRRL